MVLKKLAQSKLRIQILTAASVLLGLIIGGTIAYHYMEGWTWSTSFYFVVSTLTTVGFGDVVPSSDASRLFTAFFMLTTVAIAIASLGIIGTSFLREREAAMEKREEKIKSKEKMLLSLRRAKQGEEK